MPRARTTMATSVRIVLPSDAVLRVPVHAATTAGDVAARTRAQLQQEKARAVDGEDCTRGSLFCVRRDEELREEERLQGVVRHDEIFEWRVDMPHGAPELAYEKVAPGGHGAGNQRAIQASADAAVPSRSTATLRLRRHAGRRCGRIRLRLPSRKRNRIQLGRVQDVPKRKPESPLRRQSSTREGEITLARFLPRDFLLRAGFEFIAHVQRVQTTCHRLLVVARDVNASASAPHLDELFGAILQLAQMTSDAQASGRGGDRGDSFANSNDKSSSSRPDKAASVRAYYPLLSRSLWSHEMPVILRGYVVCAEWVALWRNQRRLYACLCDGAMLHLFASKAQCQEYMFELTREHHHGPDGEGQDHNAALHRRILKENAPQMSIDLLQLEWNVRKGESSRVTKTSSASAVARHAFALFDRQGKMRLIMDVRTQRDADQWISAIKREIAQAEVYAAIERARAEIGQLAPEQLGCTASIPLLLRGGSGRSSSVTCELPLRWLHSQVDRATRGQGRVERQMGMTLNQALKDARRDRVKINGELYSGMCVEEIVGALLMEITRLAGEGAAAAVSPMLALQFAQQLLIASSRTQGGGDILDALQLLLGNEHFCFCPDANEMEPIGIQLCKAPLASMSPQGGVDDTGVALVADIWMRMRYRVLSVSQVHDDGHASQQDGAARSTSPSGSDALLLVGVYHRRVVCSADQWHRIEGSVQIAVDTNSKLKV